MTNLVYYTNIGYFPSQFPVVKKYNDDDNVCNHAHRCDYDLYNFHSIEFHRIIGIFHDFGDIYIFWIHAWKLDLDKIWTTALNERYL